MVQYVFILRDGSGLKFLQFLLAYNLISHSSSMIHMNYHLMLKNHYIGKMVAQSTKHKYF